MRTTKASQRRYINKLTETIKADILRCGDNVGVYLPHLTDEDIAILRQYFSEVKRDYFGYVRFRS